MEDQESVLEEHVEVEGRDSPAEDFPQVYIEAFCSCYSTLSLQSSGCHIKDQSRSSRLLLGVHLDYSYSCPPL